VFQSLQWRLRKLDGPPQCLQGSLMCLTRLSPFSSGTFNIIDECPALSRKFLAAKTGFRGDCERQRHPCDRGVHTRLVHRQPHQPADDEVDAVGAYTRAIHREGEEESADRPGEPRNRDIGGVEDRWYQIQTPDGATGWVFGELLLPFNQAHPEQAYREIVERHLASEAGMLRDEVEFLEFLAHVRPNLPEALVSDFELARLEGIDRAVAPFSLGLSPLSAPWMAEHLAELEPHVREGYLWIHDAYWAWLERNHHHPAAERLAWRATQNPSVISIEGLVDEAEGEGLGEDVECDSECDISYLTAGQFNEWVRYLRLYPDGTHAVAAVEGMVEILNWVPCETRTDSGVITCTCGIAGENFRKGLQAALEVLLPVKGAQAAAARERINALLGACSPVGATAQPAPASGISTAQPFAL